MKRILSGFVFLGVFLFASCVFASQSVKIIGLKGEVTLKKTAQANWEKAQVSMLLGKEAELKTGNSSTCLLAFDGELKNVLELKENSQLRIENVLPGKVFLPEGRVFALIDSLSKTQEFQVRTPTAIAGARGTGWLTISTVIGSSVLCFDDTVHIQGLNPQGNMTGERDLDSRLGINIDTDGALGEFFQLGGSDLRDWDDFRSDVEDKRAGLESDNDVEGGSSLGFGDSSDLREEQKQDYSQETLVQERESETSAEPAQEQPSEPPSDPQEEDPGDDYYTHQ